MFARTVWAWTKPMASNVCTSVRCMTSISAVRATLKAAKYVSHKNAKLLTGDRIISWSAQRQQPGDMTTFKGATTGR